MRSRPLPTPPWRRWLTKPAPPAPSADSTPSALEQLLREHIENCDQRLTDIQDGVAALQQGALPAEHVAVLTGFTPQALHSALTGGLNAGLTPGQHALLTSLQTLLSDPESVRGLETAIRVGRWTNGRRRTRPAHR